MYMLRAKAAFQGQASLMLPEACKQASVMTTMFPLPAERIVQYMAAISRPLATPMAG